MFLIVLALIFGFGDVLIEFLLFEIILVRAPSSSIVLLLDKWCYHDVDCVNECLLTYGFSAYSVWWLFVFISSAKVMFFGKVCKVHFGSFLCFGEGDAAIIRGNSCYRRL